MKTIQSAVALIVVVGLVFGIAYLLQYYSAPPSIPTDTAVAMPAGGADLKLFFPETVVEKWVPEQAGQFEVGMQGHRDFWFSNPHKVAIKLGVDSQSCKCARVEACTFPEATSDKVKRWQFADGVAQAATAHAGMLGVMSQAVIDETVLRDSLGAKLKWVVLHIEGNTAGGGSVTIEPQAAGLVRLVWVGKNPGPVRHAATLWTQAQTGATAPRDFPRLEVPVILMMPLVADRMDYNLGDLTPRETKQAVFWCMSATRAAFDLHAEVLNRDKQPDPCVNCSLRPMTSEEREEVAQRTKMRVLHGYCLTVDVHERISEGVQLDLGPFRRRIRFQSDIAQDEGGPALLGTVRGDVSVGVDPDRDSVPFKSFDAVRGARKEVVLATDPGVELGAMGLEVEPEYLKVTLTKEAAVKGAVGNTYRLLVEVPPQTAAGVLSGQVFIQVKTPGNPPRRIRIPVTGIAYN